METWRPIKDFDWLYEVSSMGRVRTARRGRAKRVLKFMTDKDGYNEIRLHKLGRWRQVRVCRLVAFAFHGEPPTPRHEVNHINLIRHDDRAENLEWTTHKANVQHSFRRKSALAI